MNAWERTNEEKITVIIECNQKPEREKRQHIADGNNSKVTGWTNAAFVFTAWCWRILGRLATSWILRCCQEEEEKTPQNKLTDTQTNKANISFFFPGDGSVGGKDPCCLNDISNNSSGKLRSISSHRVSIIPLLWLPRACLAGKQTGAFRMHR